jgi:hypothetical protein
VPALRPFDPQDTGSPMLRIQLCRLRGLHDPRELLTFVTRTGAPDPAPPSFTAVWPALTGPRPICYFFSVALV